MKRNRVAVNFPDWLLALSLTIWFILLISLVYFFFNEDEIYAEKIDNCRYIDMSGIVDSGPATHTGKYIKFT